MMTRSLVGQMMLDSEQLEVMGQDSQERPTTRKLKTLAA
jgi:hypothetical protein